MSSSQPTLASQFKTLYGAQASQYENLTGGVTKAIALQLLSAHPLPASLSPSYKIHDNCAGPGVVTSVLLSQHPTKPFQITLTDLSSDFISLCKDRFAHEGVVKAEVMDGQDLQFPEGYFDRSYTLFGVFFYQDRTRGFQELYRTLKPDGLAVVTVWKEVGFVAVLLAVVARFSGKYPRFWGEDMAKKVRGFAEGPQREWEDPKVLENCMREAGFEVEMSVCGDAFRGDGLEVGLMKGMGMMVGLEGEGMEAWGRVWKEVVEEEKREGGVVQRMGDVWGVEMIANVAFGRKV